MLPTKINLNVWDGHIYYCLRETLKTKQYWEYYEGVYPDNYPAPSSATLYTRPAPADIDFGYKIKSMGEFYLKCLKCDDISTPLVQSCRNCNNILIKRDNASFQCNQCGYKHPQSKWVCKKCNCNNPIQSTLLIDIDLEECKIGKNKSATCFIATACYGDYNSSEVLIFRNYRDNTLLKTKFGAAIVSSYYFLSPFCEGYSQVAIIKKYNSQILTGAFDSKDKKNQYIAHKFCPITNPLAQAH